MHFMKRVSKLRVGALLAMISLTLAVPILGAKRPDANRAFNTGQSATAGAAAALDPRRIIIFLPQ
jgi:hypothetical protein